MIIGKEKCRVITGLKGKLRKRIIEEQGSINEGEASLRKPDIKG